MQTVRQILQFIKALLGFLLNLKKKQPDVERKEPDEPEMFPAIRPTGTEGGIGLVSGCPGDVGPVGGPFGNSTRVYRSPVDTLGVRTWRQATTAFAGWSVYGYALGSCLLNG